MPTTKLSDFEPITHEIFEEVESKGVRPSPVRTRSKTEGTSNNLYRTNVNPVHIERNFSHRRRNNTSAGVAVAAIGSGPQYHQAGPPPANSNTNSNLEVVPSSNAPNGYNGAVGIGSNSGNGTNDGPNTEEEAVVGAATSSANPIQGTTSSSAPSTSGPSLSAAGGFQGGRRTIDSSDVDSSQSAETSSKSKAEAAVGDGDDLLKEGLGSSQEGLQEGENDSVDGDEDGNGNHVVAEKEASRGNETLGEKEKETDGIASAERAQSNSTQDLPTAPKASSTATSSANPIQGTTSSSAPSTSGPSLSAAGGSQAERGTADSIDGSQFAQPSSKPMVEAIRFQTQADDGSNGAVGNVLNSGNGFIDPSIRSASLENNAPNTENEAIVGDLTSVQKKRISGQNGNETIQRDEMVGDSEEIGKGKGKENAAEKNVEKEGVLKVSSFTFSPPDSTDIWVIIAVNESLGTIGFKKGDKDFPRHGKRDVVCHTVVLSHILQSFDAAKFHTIQYHTNDSITANAFKELNNASSNFKGYMDASLDPKFNVVLVSTLGWIKDTLQQLKMTFEALPEMRADRSNLSKLAGSSLVVCWGYYDLSDGIKPEVLSPGGTSSQLHVTFRFQASDRPKASSSGNRPAGAAKSLTNVRRDVAPFQPMIGSDNKAIIHQRPMELEGGDVFSSTASSIAGSSKTSQSHANGQASASSAATSSRTSCSTPDGSTKGSKFQFTSPLKSLTRKSRVKVPNQEANFDSSPSNILDSHGKNGQGVGSGSSIFDSPTKNKLKIGFQSVSKVFSSPLKPRSDAKSSSPAVSSPLKAAGTFGQGSNSDAGVSGTPNKVRNATSLGTPRTQSAQSPSIKGPARTSRPTSSVAEGSTSPIKTVKTAAKSIVKAVVEGQAAFAARL